MQKKPTYDELEHRVHELEKVVKELKQAGETSPHEKAFNTDERRQKEREASLRLTQFCFDSAAIGIYHIQSDGRILNVNAHAAGMLGYTIEEMSELFIWDVDPDTSQNIFAKDWQNTLETGVAHFEVTQTGKDGRRVPMEITAKLLDYDNRKFLVCFAQDITKRKKAEEALKKNERLLGNILESMSEGLFVLDSDFRYTIFNSSLRAMTQARMEDVIGKTPLEIFPFLKSTPVVENLKKTLRGEPVKKMEIELPLPNGDRIWFRDSLSPLKDDEGNVVGMVGVISDVTRRKRAENERESLLKELQEALENVKALSGLLPICASCKKIRDDEGYWNQIEHYIQTHTEAEFSHGLCPECVKKLYPDYDIIKD